MHHLAAEPTMPKKAPISDEHKNDMQTFLQARLAHLLQVGHGLQVDDGVVEYIRIGGSRNDIKFYPHATPIYEVIGVTLDDRYFTSAQSG